MDLDDLDGPSQVPLRTTKFAPGRGFKPKAKPKAQPSSKLEPEEPAPKQEQQESAPKPEQLDAPILKKKENEVEERNPQPPVVAASPKTECSVLNHATKMDIDAKAEAIEESKHDDPMDEDCHEQQEEEDTVVREIDVFFTPSIDANTKLYVLQYPLRPCWRPYELDERCEEVRVKPGSAEVEVDLSIDANSRNYDSGSKLQMTKQTLSSWWDPPRATGYAVGVLIGDKLHLNPVHAVVQLRPSMEYLKSGDKRKSNMTANAEGIVKSEESNEEKSAGSSKKQNKLVESSTEQKTDDEKCWVPLKYHGPHTDFSSRYLQRMTAQEGSPIHFSMSPYEYVNSLCPGGSNKNIKPKGPSRRILLSMPLEERYQKLLCEGSSFHRFSTLKHYAPDDSIEDVLGVLQQHALLVQGLWTPKTRLLNLDPVLACARDYMLVLFSKNLTISSSKVDTIGSFRDKVKVKEIANTLAVERQILNDWKLKEDPDWAFVKQYPDIVKKQEQIWKAMEETVLAVIRGAKSGAGSRKNVGTKPGTASKPEKSLVSDKGATRSLSGMHGRRTMSDGTRKALPQALKKVFQNHKVCSFQLICQGLRDLAVSKSNNPKADSSKEVDAAFGADAPPEELQEVISQVATNIHGFYVLKSSPDHPEHDPLRKVVIDLLCVKGPEAKLKKADVFTAAKIALDRDITNNEYNKVMNDLCESKGSAWVLKRGDGNTK